MQRGKTILTPVTAIRIVTDTYLLQAILDHLWVSCTAIQSPALAHLGNKHVICAAHSYATKAHPGWQKLSLARFFNKSSVQNYASKKMECRTQQVESKDGFYGYILGFLTIEPNLLPGTSEIKQASKASSKKNKLQRFPVLYQNTIML